MSLHWIIRQLKPIEEFWTEKWLRADAGEDEQYWAWTSGKVSCGQMIC